MIIALLTSLIILSISCRRIKKNTDNFNITKAEPWTLMGFIIGGFSSIYLILLLITDLLF
jgi:hypothetical protein